MKKLTALATLAAAPICAAQQGWVLETDRTVLTPRQPTAQLTLSATHAPEDWAFASGRVHVLMTPSESAWLWNVDVLLRAMGTDRYFRTDRGIEYLWVAQSHLPPEQPADPASPIVAARLEAHKGAPGVETLRLTTETIFYRVALSSTEPGIEDRTADEAALEIRITDCEADCDADGELTFFDFLCFQEMFSLGDGYADCDGSGTIDLFDFLCFQNDFAAGCP